jgi:hypothetical protein
MREQWSETGMLDRGTGGCLLKHAGYVQQRRRRRRQQTAAAAAAAAAQAAAAARGRLATKTQPEVGLKMVLTAGSALLELRFVWSARLREECGTKGVKSNSSRGHSPPWWLATNPESELNVAL